MKSKALKSFGIFAGVLSLASHSALSAQECVAQADLSDGVIYAVPLAMDALAITCGEVLSAEGFVNNGDGAQMRAAFAEQQDAAWPGARRILDSFANEGGTGGIDDLIKNLPDESFRPFFDAIIVQKIAESIPFKECANVERGLALLAPMPPENVGGLAAFLFDMTGAKNPKLCPYEPSE